MAIPHLILHQVMVANLVFELLESGLQKVDRLRRGHAGRRHL